MGKQGPCETRDTVHQSGRTCTNPLHEPPAGGQPLSPSRPFKPRSQRAARLPEAELAVPVFLNTRTALPAPRIPLPSAARPAGNSRGAAGPLQGRGANRTLPPAHGAGSLEPHPSTHGPADAPALAAIGARLDPGAPGSLVERGVSLLTAGWLDWRSSEDPPSPNQSVVLPLTHDSLFRQGAAPRTRCSHRTIPSFPRRWPVPDLNPPPRANSAAAARPCLRT